MLLKLKKTSSIPAVCPFHHQLEQHSQHQHNHDNQKYQQHQKQQQQQQQQQQQPQHQQQQQHQQLQQQQQDSESTTTTHQNCKATTTTSLPQPFESIPGPKPSLPFIGTNWTYLPLVGPFAGLDLNEINQLKYSKYGPIIKEELVPGYPMLTIFEPSDIKQVFKSEATCPARPALEYIVKHRKSDPERYPNIGLANMMGSEWRELRSKLAPVMLSKGLKGRFIESQNRVSSRLVEFVRNKSSSSSSLVDVNQNVNINNNSIYNERTSNRREKNGNNIRYDSVLDEEDVQDEDFLMMKPTSATTDNSQDFRINYENSNFNDDIYYAITTSNLTSSWTSSLSKSQELTSQMATTTTAATRIKTPETTTTSTKSHVIDNVQDIFSRYAMESIMNLCISHEITCLDDTKATLAAEDGEKILSAAMLFFEAQHKLYYGSRILNFFNHENQYEQLCASHNDIHDIASKYIDRVIRRLENDCISEMERETILDTLYRSKAFTNMLDIKASIVDFIIGGIYPLANALTMTLYLLATNPSAQERVYDEIKTHLNVRKKSTSASQKQNNNNNNIDNRFCFTRNYMSNNNNNNDDYIEHHHQSNLNTNTYSNDDIELDLESLERLKYLKLCLKEAHRMMPTIPGIARIIQRDLTLSNYHVPKNTLVFCNSMTTCRMGKYFDRPDEFVPERWDRNSPLRDSSKNPDLNFAMLQFGYGSRKCIGHTFADLQMNIALAKLIRSYQIETVDPESNSTNLEREFNFIVVPKKPVKLRFIPRNE